MATGANIGLFEGFGIEIEYMLVDQDSLSVLPISHKILRDNSGNVQNEIECDGYCWSNELVSHVLEVKTDGPTKNLFETSKGFEKQVQTINGKLHKYNSMLLPSGMHPFMDPCQEMKLWEHEYNPIYTAFDRIFSCKGHGWANLQSMHLNLPFSGDDEFGRLHAAIRLILPIIPALCASSPIVEGKLTGYLDSRMNVYRTNSSKIPSISGLIIPEPVFTQDEYENKILQKIYSDLASYDPEKILAEEWVNARGAIARFERNTIEIRVIDSQESPQADLAVASIIIAAIHQLVYEKNISFDNQKLWQVEPLYKIFLNAIHNGRAALVNNDEYVKIFGADPAKIHTLGDLWKHIFLSLKKEGNTYMTPFVQTLEYIIEQDTLAKRILNSLKTIDSQSIAGAYRKLSSVLQENSLY